MATIINGSDNFSTSKIDVSNAPDNSIVLNSGGYLQSSNKPAFIVYATGETQRSSTGLISDEFTSVLKNTGNHYNTSTGYFTAPVEGFYVFGWNFFNTTDGNTPSRFGIWHNGATTGYGISTGDDISDTSSGSLLMHLQVGDTVALGTQNASYTAYWYASQQHNRFWGYFLG